MASHGSKKRRGQPGHAATPVRQAPRPAASPAPARVATSVTPEPERGGWALPTWLMLAATAWACFILWRALFHWDDTEAGADGGQAPWPLLVLVVVSGVSSFAAFWMLREGSQRSVRIPLWIAAVTGIQGVLVSACAFVSLWVRWRARVAARWAATMPPTRRTARR